MDENPYIFLRNNLLLQFLIADKYRIYRHITACVSLLLFFLITKEWGAYEGIFDILGISGLDREVFDYYSGFLPKSLCAYSSLFV